MTEQKRFFLFGAAALGKVALDAALLAGWSCLGVFDDDPQLKGRLLLSRFAVDNCRDRLGNMRHKHRESSIFIAIGTCSTREKLTYEFCGNGYRPIGIRHPRSIISQHAVIDESVAIMGGVSVEPDAIVKCGTLLNTNSMVAHDCMVGDFCHVAVGAVLAGGVHLGRRVFVGAGAVIKPGIKICDDVTIGAGAAVVKDISESGIWAGVPATKLR